MNFKEFSFIIKINKEYRVSSFCWQNLGSLFSFVFLAQDSRNGVIDTSQLRLLNLSSFWYARLGSDFSASFKASNEFCCGSHWLNVLYFRVNKVKGLLQSPK
jgi:hypothetical protein